MNPLPPRAPVDGTPPGAPQVVGALQHAIEGVLRRPVDVLAVAQVGGRPPQAVATRGAVAPEVPWPVGGTCVPQATVVHHDAAGLLVSVAARSAATADWSLVTGDLTATATVLATMVADHVELGDLRQDVGDLTNAMRTRAVIDQAMGVVMARRRCTPGQALDVLRAWSQDHNEKLSAVAARVVTCVAGPVPPRTPFVPRRQAGGTGTGTPAMG
ncbi:ANTAR domain-containing protein [Cellulomonas dongxiuzhuiae]|uniref:ANTAR domain-containing protein n=1 Tax=Cellulomonas dongxiuzhuiae TaxID=2819979 RepID=UPI001AAF1684|nr:ANTAR domain-containing protein [Cellulomonas dongxiuzhuiae]MBO3089893.1 ANTAR domain-containing protein [Cellulomonas dongxiuzhuiae]